MPLPNITFMATKKQYLSLYLDPAIVKFIDEIITKKGMGANRNAFITEAIDHYLRLKYGFRYIFRKKGDLKQAGRPRKE